MKENFVYTITCGQN